MSDDVVRLCLVNTPHKTLFPTTMFDPNRGRENRLKGKFKGLLDPLTGVDRLRNEHPRPTGSRWEFMTPTLVDSILTRFRSTFTRALEVTRGGTSVVRVYNAQIDPLAHVLCFGDPRM